MIVIYVNVFNCSVFSNDMQSHAIPTPSGLLLFHEDDHPGDLGEYGNKPKFSNRQI